MKAVVVGGSIGGLSAAHALLKAGLDVLVLEKALSVSAAGAGLGLDRASESTLASFGFAEQFSSVTVPMMKEVNHAVTADTNLSVAAKDDNMDIYSTHWTDIHGMLQQALPEHLLRKGHRAVRIRPSDDQVEVDVEVHDKEQLQHFSADVLIAADGSMSETRRHFLPNEDRRYSGYCAWRGVLKRDEDPSVWDSVHEAYPDMGDCLYFDMTQDEGHAVAYVLPGGRLNWLWYNNQPEPELPGASVTLKADDAMIADMKRRASTTFPKALSDLMQATTAPFLNAIYDREPLKQFVWGRVALLGEAAHPTTPHGLRSTNMAIADSASLGEAFARHANDPTAALEAYQEARLQPTTREVLFSRWLGRLKQNLGMQKLDWARLPPGLAGQVLQRRRESFDPESCLVD